MHNRVLHQTINTIILNWGNIHKAWNYIMEVIPCFTDHFIIKEVWLIWSFLNEYCSFLTEKWPFGSGLHHQCHIPNAINAQQYFVFMYGEFSFLPQLFKWPCSGLTHAYYTELLHKNDKEITFMKLIKQQHKVRYQTNSAQWTDMNFKKQNHNIITLMYTV